MLNRRIVLLASVLLGATSACSGSNERYETAAQGIELGDGADAVTDGSADAAATCAHSLCALGESLREACDPCVATLCSQDPYCCNGGWDGTCVGEVSSICGKSCTADPVKEDAGASTCAHPVCAVGVALTSSCEPCAAQLCAQDPYCCGVAWDTTCVTEVGSICGQKCN